MKCAKTLGVLRGGARARILFFLALVAATLLVGQLGRKNPPGASEDKSIGPGMFSLFQIFAAFAGVGKQISLANLDDVVDCLRSPQSDANLVWSSIRNLFPWSSPEKMFELFVAASSKRLVIVDVGANLGQFSFPAAKLGHKVFAFEPFKENYMYMMKKATELRLESSMKIINAAVGATSGKVHVSLMRSDDPTGVTAANTGCLMDLPCHQIKKVTLDETVKEKVDLLKIDVQGFEEEVVNGALKLIKNFGVQVIIFEFDVKLLRAQSASPIRLLNLLCSLNYILYEGSRLYVDPQGAVHYDNNRSNTKCYYTTNEYIEILENISSTGGYTDMMAVRRT